LHLKRIHAERERERERDYLVSVKRVTIGISQITFLDHY
jgi:hypothetical protein